jgi:rhodanese-related sulfurtransferase
MCGEDDVDLDFDSLAIARDCGYTLIDVREPEEIASQPPPLDCLQIPLNTLLEDSSVLDAARPYLLICARGARSRALALELRTRELARVYSLRGGLVTMAARVES